MDASGQHASCQQLGGDQAAHRQGMCGNLTIAVDVLLRRSEEQHYSCALLPYRLIGTFLPIDPRAQRGELNLPAPQERDEHL